VAGSERGGGDEQGELEFHDWICVGGRSESRCVRGEMGVGWARGHRPEKQTDTNGAAARAGVGPKAELNPAEHENGQMRTDARG
jgi:hypothetical protein